MTTPLGLISIFLTNGIEHLLYTHTQTPDMIMDCVPAPLG